MTRVWLYHLDWKTGKGFIENTCVRFVFEFNLIFVIFVVISSDRNDVPTLSPPPESPPPLSPPPESPPPFIISPSQPVYNAQPESTSGSGLVGSGYMESIYGSGEYDSLDALQEVTCTLPFGNNEPAFGASFILVANMTSNRFFQAVNGNFRVCPTMLDQPH